MPSILEVSQEKDSSDCGFFCAYIAAEINKGIPPLSINFTRDDIYRFRNRHMGLSYPGKSPKTYVGMNAAPMMPVLLGLAGAHNYEVRKYDKGDKVEFLRRYMPPTTRDAMLISMPVHKHWVMIIGPEFKGQRYIYDSSNLSKKGHLTLAKTDELDEFFPYATDIVTRPYATSVKRRSSRVAA
ncbi:MAG: hypothetical protein AAGL24_04670 [Pseudomonadota bacterium]